MKIQLREVPEDAPDDEARELMRTHVHVSISVQDRHPDDRQYLRTGYRLYVDREMWYGATDTERAAALTEAASYVARRTAEDPRSRR